MVGSRISILKLHHRPALGSPSRNFWLVRNNDCFANFWTEKSLCISSAFGCCNVFVVYIHSGWGCSCDSNASNPAPPVKRDTCWGSPHPALDHSECHYGFTSLDVPAGWHKRYRKVPYFFPICVQRIRFWWAFADTSRLLALHRPWGWDLPRIAVFHASETPPRANNCCSRSLPYSVVSN